MQDDLKGMERFTISDKFVLAPPPSAGDIGKRICLAEERMRATV